jgi:hypothetical protein
MQMSFLFSDYHRFFPQGYTIQHRKLTHSLPSSARVENGYSSSSEMPMWFAKG